MTDAKATAGHTAGPWAVVNDPCVPDRVIIERRDNGRKSLIADMGRILGHGGTPKANAERIVRAVNGFDALVEALRHCRGVMAANCRADNTSAAIADVQARAALAAAGVTP